MATQRTAKPPASKAVFINCPFDDGFKPIFRAMVFAVIASGYEPRCALDATDGAEIRVSKIAKMCERTPNIDQVLNGISVEP